MKPADIAAFFERLRDLDPVPRNELIFTSPYTLLVAVVLSAQMTDTGVNRATGPLFAIADTPEKMLALGEEALAGYLKSINLYKTKARHVIALSQRLLDSFDGQVPRRREDLESLPGVGRKTANVVLNVAFELPTMAVDTHIFRVCNRTGLAPGKTPRAVEDRLEAIVPDPFRIHAHRWLVLHGRYICKARKPACDSCPVRDLCPFPRAGKESKQGA
ncbi:MAG TPA: endonuclease III [Alphaproteobacteria bacterium]|nr:endonuclease III [Alphaproteobacteria bacterium]